VIVVTDDDAHGSRRTPELRDLVGDVDRAKALPGVTVSVVSKLMADTSDPDPLRCSFCAKSQKQVKKLIAGPSVLICDECIDLSTRLIESALLEEPLPEATDLKLKERPTPQAIRTVLETGDFRELEVRIITLAANGARRHEILDKLDLWDEKFVNAALRRVFRECSFCEKDQMQVKWLIVGVTDCICDECLDLCAEIIEEAEEDASDVPETPGPPPREPPTPEEMERRRASLPQLTDREKEVLKLLSRGSNGEQIASALGISRNAVRTYVQSILVKLQLPPLSS
jgi:DNA-binding CsgD family transcriptional regulator